MTYVLLILARHVHIYFQTNDCCLQDLRVMVGFQSDYKIRVCGENSIPLDLK